MKRRRERFWIALWIAPRGYGVLALVALLFGLAGSFAPLLWLAVASSALALAAFITDAALGPRRNLFEVERLAPQPFSLRRAGSLSYRVRNASSYGVRAGILEAPSPLLHYDADEVTAPIAPRSQACVVRAVTPVARGTAQLNALYCWYENGLGLLRRRLRITQEHSLRVYPDLSAVERYGNLHMRNRLIESGLRRMKLRGTGTELESMREWAPGDAFRAINWKATARRGRVMVAQYEVERTQNVMIVLDAGRLMTARVDEQRKLDYAVTAALSVASVAALANDKVGLVAFAAQILRAAAPRPSGRANSRIAGLLHDLEPRFEEADYESAFAYVRAHVRKRSLIVFFTDMVDPVAQSSVLAQIGTLARRHLVVCAFMNDAAIERRLETPAERPDDAYATAVALELQDERKTAAAVLSRMGVQVIDVPARTLTTSLIDRYLQIKARGLL
ncbi:MAG TPA: DUF58 domain-containing protein [Candidatus Baltobacteraceae bacterium]|nr:DUF58 domain-containing protein [Candidatus Baltobacteraceae bacterium]